MFFFFKKNFKMNCSSIYLKKKNNNLKKVAPTQKKVKVFNKNIVRKIKH